MPATSTNIAPIDTTTATTDRSERQAPPPILGTHPTPFWRRVLTGTAFAIPILGCLSLVVGYGVNLIIDDQWDDVTVIKSSYGHFPDWSALWALHNENRIFFPNLIVTALAHFDHFDIVHEELIGCVFLIAAYFLFIATHKRRSPSTPWIYYAPVMALGLCVTQWQNMLWGFQMAWFLVMLALAFTLFLLDRITLSWPVLVVAAVSATVGSYSSLQGLAIWIAGLVLLYYRRRPLPQVMAWIAATVVATLLYFHHYTAKTFLPGYASHHPIATLKFVLFEIGDIVGIQYPYQNYAPVNWPVLLFGIGLLLLAILAIVFGCGFRRDTESGRPLGVALIVTTVLFALMVAEGRVFFGYVGASESRYATFNLLILVGTYFILVPSATRKETGGEAPRRHLRALLLVAGLAIVFQLVWGTYNGIYAASSNHQQQVHWAKIERNIPSEPDNQVALLYFYYPASRVRHQARIARQLHLSLFNP